MAKRKAATGRPPGRPPKKPGPGRPPKVPVDSPAADNPLPSNAEEPSTRRSARTKSVPKRFERADEDEMDVDDEDTATRAGEGEGKGKGKGLGRVEGKAKEVAKAKAKVDDEYEDDDNEDEDEEAEEEDGEGEEDRHGEADDDDDDFILLSDAPPVKAHSGKAHGTTVKKFSGAQAAGDGEEAGEEEMAQATKAVKNLLGINDRVPTKAPKKGAKQPAVTNVDGDSDSEDLDAYDIFVFKVPQKNGAVDSIGIAANTSFERFRFKLAEGMDVSVNKLNVGYTLSTWPAKEPLSLLSKASHLAGLFEALAKDQERLDKAAKKGNNAKELFVKIKDLNDTKAGKGKAGKASKKGKKADEREENDADLEAMDGSVLESNEEEPKKVSASWAYELEMELKCDREGVAKCLYGKCWKQGTPGNEKEEKIHHPISPRDASFWLFALSTGKWKNAKRPPDVIVDRILAEEAAKKANASSDKVGGETSNGLNSSAGSSVSSQSFPFQMPAIHFHTGSLVNGSGGYMSSPTKLPTTAKKQSSELAPSALEAIPAKNFPLTRDFLAAVDQEDLEGGDSSNFSQYADQLIEKGYRRIHLLFDETPKSLQVDLELPISMGDAKQLLLHVKRACQKVVRAES